MTVLSDRNVEKTSKQEEEIAHFQRISQMSTAMDSLPAGYLDLHDTIRLFQSNSGCMRIGEEVNKSLLGQLWLEGFLLPSYDCPN